MNEEKFNGNGIYLPREWRDKDEFSVDFEDCRKTKSSATKPKKSESRVVSRDVLTELLTEYLHPLSVNAILRKLGFSHK